MNELDSKIETLLEDIATGECYGYHVKDFRNIILEILREELHKAANPNYEIN